MTSAVFEPHNHWYKIKTCLGVTYRRNISRLRNRRSVAPRRREMKLADTLFLHHIATESPRLSNLENNRK